MAATCCQACAQNRCFRLAVRIGLDNAGNASTAPLRVEGPCETDIATPFYPRVPRTPRGRYCVWEAVWAAVQILEGTLYALP